MKRVIIKIIKWLGISLLLITAAVFLFTAGYISCLRMDGIKQLEKGELFIEKEVAVERTDDFIKYDVRLANDRGLQVDVFVKVPASITGKIPAVLLLGGFETGRKAVDLLNRRFDMMLISMNYPYARPGGENSMVAFFRTIHALNRAVYRTDTAVRLALDFLKRKDFVDRGRIVMVGASLAAPFAVRAAALNKDVKALALLYGFGDLYGIYKKLLEPRLKQPLLVKSLARLATIVFPAFEPLDFIGRVSPRPVLLINGRDDERIPRHCVEKLHKAAREPKKITWLDGKHMHPTNTALIRQLIDLVIEWMEDFS